MRSSRKRTLLLIALVLLILSSLGGFYLYMLGAFIQPAGGLSAVLEDVQTMVSAFIINNNERFPDSEDSLIHQDLLKKSESPQGWKYFMQPVRADGRIITDAGWLQLHRFELFRLKYAVRAHDIEQRNGKLYNKATGNEVLLIEGPYKKTMKFLPTNYQTVSSHWYRLMTSIISSDANAPSNELRRK